MAVLSQSFLGGKSALKVAVVWFEIVGINDWMEPLLDIRPNRVHLGMVRKVSSVERLVKNGAFETIRPNSFFFFIHAVDFFQSLQLCFLSGIERLFKILPELGPAVEICNQLLILHLDAECLAEEKVCRFQVILQSLVLSA